MKTKFFTFFFFLFLLFFLTPKSANADQCPPPTLSPQTVPRNSKTVMTITSDADPLCFQANTEYTVVWFDEPTPIIVAANSVSVNADVNNVLTFDLELRDFTDTDQSEVWVIFVCNGTVYPLDCANRGELVRAAVGFTVTDDALPDASETPEAPLPILDRAKQKACVVAAGDPLELLVTNLLPDTDYQWFYPGGLFNVGLEKGSQKTGPNEDSFNFTLKSGDTKNPGDQVVCVDFDHPPVGVDFIRVTAKNCLIVTFRGDYVVDSETDTSCSEESELKLNNTPPSPLPPCPNNSGGFEKFDEKDASKGGCKQFNTALGSIATNPSSFIGSIMGVVLSLAGGIAILLIIISGYQMLTSRGNPEAIEAARERLTSAVIGLLFIIFSTVIFELIGVDILHLPCFNDPKCNQTTNAPSTAPGTDPVDCGGENKPICKDPNAPANKERGVLKTGCKPGLSPSKTSNSCIVV